MAKRFNPENIGLFWEDRPKARKREAQDRGPPPDIPVTGWTPPSEFPNLSAAKVIGVDTETYDPELEKCGPGWGRGSGYIIGVSLSVQDGTSWYFPIRHGFDERGKQVLPPEEAAMNMNPDNVLAFCRDNLSDNRPKVGANLIYDMGWLWQEGTWLGGRLYDIQFAEALLDSETPGVALDDLALKYLNRGKETSILYDYLALWCGGRATDRQRKNLFLSPPSLAGPYAEADASLPIYVLNKQWPTMAARGVLDLFDLECRLIPLLVRMRMKGAPVSVDKAEEIYDDFGNKMSDIEAAMKDLAGQPVNPNARESMKAAFNALGIPLPQDATGKMSFAAPLLEKIEHPLVEKILEHKRLGKVRNTFIKSYLIDKNVNGYIHCSFNPLKGDGKGARSGRFSSSEPNLQNIPVRTDEGKLVRGCFVAKGRWIKVDYSQIEYRMLAHHAVGEGAEELRRVFNVDPDTDYHELVGQLIINEVGIELARRSIKTINFGLIYGMSQPELARRLKLAKKEASELFKNYHSAAPFIRATMDACADEVNTFGYVETLLGRKSDFNMWTTKDFDKTAPALPYHQAMAKWGFNNIKRAFTHKALNRKLQGGAADVMKKAMVMAYESGLFEDDACGIPLLTVHDELDFDDLGDPDNPAWAELKHIMETCVPELRVPIKLDMGIGPSWREAD